MVTPCLEPVFKTGSECVRHTCQELLLSHHYTHLSGNADATIWEPV